MKITRKEFVVGGALALAGCNSIPSQLRLRKLTPESGPFVSPQSGSVDLISHVLSRLTFGPRGGDYARVAKLSATPDEAVRLYIEEQLHPEAIDDAMLERALRRIECLSEPVGELFEYKEKVLLLAMTRAALLRAIWSKRQLFEVMIHFWTDHFNIDASKAECKWLKVADDRDVIRKHAMGKFSDLLRASALSPAMLWYLDGRANRKQQGADKPNENYARELMELHTLGLHGGYAQQDVMEVARCLTGWTVRSVKQLKKGSVEFQNDLHDDGAKVVLGHAIPAGQGMKDIDRVLDIVTNHPATARHIAVKLCRRFISDDPDATSVNAVAQVFQDSGGDVRRTLLTVFATDEFLSVRRTKCKRPFEFVVSALRATHADTDAGPAIIDYLLQLGHAPFQYPTPDGYPDRAEPWMGTLMWRWKFALALSTNSIPGTKVNAAQLGKDFGGEQGLMAHLLGRQPSSMESESFRNAGDGVALMLASPEFQRR